MGTTERLLRLLDLLQSRPVWSGPELAERLEVTTRSVRRDVERLRELGYPVNAAQGPGGGYRLGAGRGMPPLLLADDEAVAVAVSLRLAAAGTISGASEPALRTLTKLDQVMPPRLRGEVRAIRDATETLGSTDGQVDGDALLRLARACRDRVRVRFDYETRDGDRAERTVEPVRLVATARRWYLMAHDVDRDDWRTFRLDRMREVRATTWGFTLREHPDPVEFVQRGVTREAYRHRATIGLACSAETLGAQIPPTVGRIEPDGEQACVLHIGGDDLGWMVAHLAALGHELTSVEPPELAEEMRRTAQRLLRATQPRG